MKFLALAAVMLLAPGAAVRVERDGIRVGESLVQGPALELRGDGASAVLASGSSVEALAAGLEVEIAPGRLLTLEPGLRVTRRDGGIRLAAHGSRRIRFAAAGTSLVVEAPVDLATTAEGWIVGDATIPGAALRASLQQDDPTENLNRMLQAKEKMTVQGSKQGRWVRLYRGDVLSGAQAADSISVRTITQLTPSGAP